MPVTTLHKEYTAMSGDWKRSRDAANGIDRKNGKSYLPGFDPVDEKRYDKYLERAYYLNVAGRTRDALNGAIFRVDPSYTLPTELDYLLDDADGSGQGLVQLAKRQCNDLITVGRYGFLVDYPPAPSGLTMEQVANYQLQASILPYCAESIINWKTTKVGSSHVLSLVVLKEEVEKSIDMYDSECEHVYRVLFLRDGLYSSALYGEDGQQIGDILEPKGADGKRLTSIPFVFNGATDNKPSVDEPPMLPLAEVNIAHYRNSADFEENLFLHGQLTLGISSKISAEEFAQANPNGVQVGARQGHFLGEGGSFVTATVPANTGLREAMQDKEQQMVSIGARLITPQSATITAESARINASSETSVLNAVVGNASSALEQALRFCTVFMGGNPDEVSFQLNTDFFDTKLDPQQIMAMIQLANRGDIGQSDLRSVLRKAKLLSADRTDEEIDDETISASFPISAPSEPFATPSQPDESA